MQASADSNNLHNKSDADVVIIGGGPVGLWTAIQLKKQRPLLNIKILEKYETYQRTQILNLDLTSIEDPAFKVMLLGLVASRNAKRNGAIINISVQELEKLFSAEAERLGIEVEKGVTLVDAVTAGNEQSLQDEKVMTVETMKALHPNCEIFIGADGARSVIRQHIGNMEKNKHNSTAKTDDFTKRSDLQHFVEYQYQVKGKKNKLSPGQHFEAEMRGGRRCLETVVYDEKTKTSTITLRFFMDKKSYEALNASAKTRLSWDDNSVPKKIKAAVSQWQTARNESTSEKVDKGFNKFPVPLYRSRRYAKLEENKNNKTNAAFFLVGDAAMGLPYYRSLNVGLVSGSKLAEVLSDHFRFTQATGQPDKFLSNRIKSYTTFMANRYHLEGRLVARGKDLGLSLHKNFLKASAPVLGFFSHPSKQADTQDNSPAQNHALNNKKQ